MQLGIKVIPGDLEREMVRFAHRAGPTDPIRVARHAPGTRRGRTKTTRPRWGVGSAVWRGCWGDRLPARGIRTGADDPPKNLGGLLPALVTGALEKFAVLVLPDLLAALLDYAAHLVLARELSPRECLK